ncbi:MAG: hypothetical protein CMK92_00765 [Pseudomonas sp.]|nr:hypothetical protein [Pseudomonas sp.]
MFCKDFFERYDATDGDAPDPVEVYRVDNSGTYVVTPSCQILRKNADGIFEAYNDHPFANKSTLPMAVGDDSSMLDMHNNHLYVNGARHSNHPVTMHVVRILCAVNRGDHWRMIVTNEEGAVYVLTSDANGRPNILRIDEPSTASQHYVLTSDGKRFVSFNDTGHDSVRVRNTFTGELLDTSVDLFTSKPCDVLCANGVPIQF